MIPERPRLGAHVRARRHRIGAEVRVMLHVEGAPPIALGEREWTVLRQADGSRDLEGIRVAAAHAGAPVRLDHLRAFFAQLAQLSLFDAREAAREAPAVGRDVPIVPLPGYAFACDGSGGCCRQFDTVLFTPVEVARARALLPTLGSAGSQPGRVFLPEHGVSSELSVVTRVDGRCLYLDTDDRCRIHAGKPAGCTIFPARFVDVGDAIRVVPRLECACVFGVRSGAPLTDARRGSELPPEVFVAALPDAIDMGRRRVGPRELVEYFDAQSRRIDREPDLARFAWSLAEAIDGVSAPPSFERARASVDRLSRAHVAWRAPSDLVRLGVQWVGDALATLGADLPPPREPDDEALYLRATFFATLGAGSSVEAALRERALSMWIARAVSDEARATSEAAHPLAIVEFLTRGHGLDLSGSA